MTKAERRARKKQHRRLAHPRCDQCGEPAPPGGDHDSAFSVGRVTWDGVVIVAWCQWCGHEFCS
jgi:hypothetical protein